MNELYLVKYESILNKFRGNAKGLVESYNKDNIDICTLIIELKKLDRNFNKDVKKLKEALWEELN